MAAKADPVASSIPSARSLAAALGLTHSAVNKWLRDDRWPFPKSPPWPAALLPKMRAWARNTLAEDPSASDEATKRRSDEATEGGAEFPIVGVERLGHERRAKLALTVEKAKRAKLEREIRQNLYHRVDECQRAILLKIHAVRQALSTLHEQMPRETPDPLRAWVRDRVEQICRSFAGAG